jgi:uncharacterized protein (DUF1330 family)
MSSIETTPEQFQAFRTADPDEPLLMLNLLKFKEHAEYAAGEGDTPCSGKEAYGRYMAATEQFITLVGAEVVMRAKPRRSVIAPEGEDWDLMFVVKYPSRAAMLKMLGDKEYRLISRHRRAGLSDSRLIEMDPGQH